MIYMYQAYFFQPNPMETFTEFHELILRAQVYKLTKDKREYIMQMVELFKIQDIHVSSLLFRCKVDNPCLLVHQLFIFEYQCYNLIFSPLKMTPHKAQCAFLCAFIMSACIINYALCIVHYAPCIMDYASCMCKLINNID